MPEQAHPAVFTRPIDVAGFREAVSTMVASVTVVTARSALGEPFGFTASAVASLSLEPPLLLVCADRRVDGSAKIMVRAFNDHVDEAAQVTVGEWSFDSLAGQPHLQRPVRQRLQPQWYIIHSDDGVIHVIRSRV